MRLGIANELLKRMARPLPPTAPCEHVGAGATPMVDSGPRRITRSTHVRYLLNVPDD